MKDDISPLLDIKFYCEDLHKILTIREYFKTILKTLFREGERFSGKRPFGNSGWEWDLAKPLIKAGIISGKLDEDGYIEEFDEDAYYQLIGKLINGL